ncbi:MAG: HEPN domain-containing protein [Candidatus Dojkabacteria bacterium]
MLSTESIVRQANHFYGSGLRNWETAEYLLEGRKYSDCLLFCHLSLEKILKGIYTIVNRSYAPYTHDLVKLARTSGIKLTERQRGELYEITQFNTLVRYDDEKDAFYKKANRGFTKEKFKLCSEYKSWLEKKYQELS